jgi:hypothetical protein
MILKLCVKVVVQNGMKFIGTLILLNIQRREIFIELLMIGATMNRCNNEQA